jgi:hypothetical protein
MPSFEVHGPFKIPTERRKSGRIIPKDLSAFWEDTGLAVRCGVYIFAIRAGRGITPIYVGKATRRFRGEAFADHKRAHHYSLALANYGRGTPVMFFVTWPEDRKANLQMIKDLEDFLIQTGVARNPDLSNIRGRGEKKWSISGVVRSGGKRPSKSEQAFSALMGLKKS